MDASQINELEKSFKSGWPGRPPIQVLKGLSLSVEQGEIYGFLGPNGSGKTTTLKILLGLMKPGGGRAELLGRPAGDVDARRRIGFLPESPYFYDYLTADEFLSFYGHLAGLARRVIKERTDHLLEVVGLTHARTRQLRKFSKGMLQRVGLAQALIHDPELVILDEPMSGLDPIGRKQVRDLILSLRDQGKTVFFSTHIIPDVEMICDRVGVVMNGKLQATGRVEELVHNSHAHTVEVVCEGIKGEDVPAIAKVATRLLQRGRQCLVVLPKPDLVDEVVTAMKARGGTLVSVTPQKGSLEELFVQPSEQQER